MLLAEPAHQLFTFAKAIPLGHAVFGSEIVRRPYGHEQTRPLQAELQFRLPIGAVLDLLVAIDLDFRRGDILQSRVQARQEVIRDPLSHGPRAPVRYEDIELVRHPRPPPRSPLEGPSRASRQGLTLC